MVIFKCKMCGATLEINDETVAVCDYCSTRQTLPRLDDDRRVNLYDRANHLRRNNEFDKALAIYEQILDEDNTDAEAHWSIVLCRYGIQYVEDPATTRRVPTVNRAQFTSIFDDEDYKSALEYADISQKTVYEEEAKIINEIQKNILAISQQEEPFDIFICYKETDDFGRRTMDSVYANDLYHQLTQEGFKVFFSRITLEDKIGSAYEPYIFAALHSSKVMIVLGSRPEYFNATWVKNEWSRYLALVKDSKGKKMLIPAYKDMDPYDLPDEFSHLQAQDMNKLGFMQDLIRGVKKITAADKTVSSGAQKVSNTKTASISTYLKRVFMFLEDGDWTSANDYCERILDIEPENAEAYFGKFLAELHVNNKAELKDCDLLFSNNANYRKVVRFADGDFKTEFNKCIDEYKVVHYEKSIQMLNDARSEEDYRIVSAKFNSLEGYKESSQYAEKAAYYAELWRRRKNDFRQIEEQKQEIERIQSEYYSFIHSYSGVKENFDKVNLDSNAKLALYGKWFLFDILPIIVSFGAIFLCFDQNAVGLLFALIVWLASAIIRPVLGKKAKAKYKDYKMLNQYKDNLQQQVQARSVKINDLHKQILSLEESNANLSSEIDNITQELNNIKVNYVEQ